jgi:hypothetical protein
LKFLGRARRFFQDLASEPDTKVQYFNVTCAGGHRVRGERTLGYQALRCPACGEGVFVLPRSPLPEPIAPARPAAVPGGGTGQRWVEEGPVELSEASRVSVELGADESSGGDAEIIWDDPPVETAARAGADESGPRARSGAGGTGAPPVSRTPEEGATAANVPRTEGRRRRKAQRAGEPVVRPGDRAREGESTPASRERQGRASQTAVAKARDQDVLEPALAGAEAKPKARRRSLHIWLFVLVPLLVVATLGWRYRQQRLRESPLIAERGVSEGIPALEAGDFDKANQVLSRAKAAVNALGGAVECADEIRSAADEAQIFVDLIPETPEDLLAVAGRSDALAWETRFDTLYKGRSIFIDSWITFEPSQGSAEPYEILYRVLPPGEASNFRDGKNARPDRVCSIDLTGFQLFELARPSAGNRVIFGARLAAFKYDSAKDAWVIRLEPKSGVFITHTKALEAIGWRSEPEGGEAREGGER